MPAHHIDTGAAAATNTRAAHFSVDGVKPPGNRSVPAPSIEK
jgi:hypothetical protein